MPSITVNPPHAEPITFCYNIATPTCATSESIDPSIPTVLLIATYFTPQQMWHPQLRDPALRRFNIVTFDSRGHGRTIGSIPKGWSEDDAAEDIHHFMAGLNIPEYHAVGMDSTAGIALRIAMLHPKEILSVIAVSPLPIEEPEAVLEGRKEMYACWETSVKSCEPESKENGLKDTVTGGLMLATNGDRSSTIMAIAEIAISYAISHVGTVEALEEAKFLFYEAFENRDLYPVDGLKKITCPVLLVHCSEDVAYQIGLVEEVRDRMDEAGVDVSLVSVDDAPHYGTFTHYETITPIIHDFVLQHSKGAQSSIPESVESPFEPDFAAVGCPNLGLDLDDDLEFFA